MRFAAAVFSLMVLSAVEVRGDDFFEKNVRPLLVDNCLNCHGPKKQMAGLRLDGRDAMLKGGDTGPALKPGDPVASLLIQAVKQSGDLKMPPKKKLTLQQI